MANQRRFRKLIEELADPLNSYLLRCNHYKEIYTILNTPVEVNIDQVEKLLDISKRDMKEDMRYSANALSLIPKLCEKIQSLPITPPNLFPSLVPSALEVLRILKMGADVEIDALLTLSIRCIKAYPEFVFVSLVDNHLKDIYQVLEPPTIPKNTNKHSSFNFLKVLPYRITKIILNKLPQKQKRVFIENGFEIWFKGIVPKLFAMTCNNTDDDIEECIEAVEELTETLAAFEYAEDPYWKNLKETYICKADQFPTTIKRLLESGKKYWYRLWIILVKLLKNQLTVLTSHLSKSPINVLLPPVELAFKKQQEIRYQAFLCWDTLVDSFASDITESQLTKRMQLLIIPLKASNAKIELTIVAKFNTWWNLIRKFYRKMDVLENTVLNPFLHFCFGKFVNGNYVPSSGQFNDRIKKLCIQALVEIAGHYQCEGCCQIPKLPGRLLSTKLLVDNWRDWLHYLRNTVCIAASDNSETATQHIICLWKSLVSTIAELPANNVRRDLVKDLIDVPVLLLEDKEHGAVVVDKVFNILILSLFDDEENFYSLLKTNNMFDNELLLHKIFSIILNQSLLTDYLIRKETSELLIKFRPLAMFVMNTTYNNPNVILDTLFRELPSTNTSTVLWIALAEAVSESKSKLKENTIRSFLLWPIKSLHSQPNAITSEAWSHWITLYNEANPKLKTHLNRDVLSFIRNNCTLEKSSYFGLCASLTILKNHLSDPSTNFTKEADLTITIIKKSKPQEVTKAFPLMTDTLILLLSLGSSSNIFEPGLKMLPVVLELFISTLNGQEQNKVVYFMEHILKEFDALLKCKIPQTHVTYLTQIMNILMESIPLLGENSSLIEIIKTICCKCKEFVPSICNKRDEVIVETHSDVVETHSDVVETRSDVEKANLVSNLTTPVVIIAKENASEQPKNEMTISANNTTTPVSITTPDVIDTKEITPEIRKNELTVSVNNSATPKLFITPDVITTKEKQKNEMTVSVNNFTTPKSLSRKANKNEPNIVNTFVEDGEEFVVVKSNWKFNPRKLTENQKEKLERKREDIPALYQDLSQSQDEFKLKAWKTDSQDTTNSTSNSKSNLKSSNDDVKSILKSIPSSEVVPSIIESITDKSKPDPETSSELIRLTSASTDETNKNKIIHKSAEKQKLKSEIKSPRMALKDRVFRNVRNLIEKSNVQNDSYVQPDEQNHNVNENVHKTPLTKAKRSVDCTNSAPSKISAERPSRVIKKPRKFEDSEILVIRKRGRSVTDSQPDSDLLEKPKTLEDSSLLAINKRRRPVAEPQPSSELLESINKRRRSVTDAQLDGEVPDVRVPSTNYTAKDSKEIKDIEKYIKPAINDCDVEHEKDIPIPKSMPVDNEKKDKPHHISQQAKDSNNETSVKRKIVTDSKYGKNIAIKEVKVVLTNKNISESKNTECVVSKNVDIKRQLDFSSEIEKPTNVATDDLDACNFESNADRISTETKSSAVGQVENKDNNLSELIYKQKNEMSDTTNDKCTPTSKNNSNEYEETLVKKKTSRITKQLLIDMVEGHPFLQSPIEQSPTEKRATRKTASASEAKRKKTELLETQNTSKTDNKIYKAKENKYSKGIKLKFPAKSHSVTILDSENAKECSQDLPLSEDVIESSQDSAVTAISVASAKHILTRKCTVESEDTVRDTNKFVENTQELIDKNEDIEITRNKTLLEHSEINNTENMDTEPIVEKENAEVEIINQLSTPDVINLEVIELDSQQIAEAATQPIEQENALAAEKMSGSILKHSTNYEATMIRENAVITVDSTTNDCSKDCSENLVTPTLTLTDDNGACSPLKDDLQKKNNFLNDTIEISPIKAMSPIKDLKSLSPNDSNDYVVIKLSSPVKSNGEPFEKENSPEIFTEDKISPEKLDQSPPRIEAVPTGNTSPRLSLKKQRPQVRAGGRAAQMLGLCAPGKLEEMNFETTNNSEETKRSNTVITSARRNLRILYNTATDQHSNSDGTEECENFLKFKRPVPTPDCSPAGPILKRKAEDVKTKQKKDEKADDSSPPSKRKRVSFHDPPVSTTIAVQKYIEPGAVRSPQSSALKKLERQTKSNNNIKSAKRLDTVFKLENLLTKTVESFNEEETPGSADVEMSSIEETPLVEVIKTSDLNDTDPICKDLLNCNDPIDNIASELSSPGMRDLFVKELKGKVDTIANLAKMTELEVNRLCIKVPKVATAKKVLSEYASKREVATKQVESSLYVPLTCNIEEPKNVSVDMSTQTNTLSTKDSEMQTVKTPMIVKITQTECLAFAHTSAQTNESELERPDVVDVSREPLSESSIALLSNKLSVPTILEILMSKMTPSTSTFVLNSIFAHLISQSNNLTSNVEPTFLQDFSKDLFSLSMRLLQKIHDKPA